MMECSCYAIPVKEWALGLAWGTTFIKASHKLSEPHLNPTDLTTLAALTYKAQTDAPKHAKVLLRLYKIFCDCGCCQVDT
jgi:hypothetical protein